MGIRRNPEVNIGTQAGVGIAYQGDPLDDDPPAALANEPWWRAIRPATCGA